MSRHLFTSDLHLGHDKVARLRGFGYSEPHDEYVIERLRRAVGKDDVLWVLGDVVGRAKDLPYAQDLLAEVPGRKRLVLGNHDPAHPSNRNAFRSFALLAECWEWWGMAARTKVGGQEVVLSHFPYERDRGPVRFRQWRLRNEGSWLLHGHTHGPERVTVTEDLGHLPEREVHVGWDAWRRPVADHEVADLIRS